MAITNRHKVSKAGLERLQQKRALLEQQLTDAGKRAGEAAGVNCDWHDNPAYDDAVNQMRMLSFQIEQVKQAISQAEVVEEPSDQNIVQIGSTVIVCMDSEEVEYQIGGLNEGNPSAGIVSYESPLGRALIGHKTGDVVQVMTPSGTITTKLLAVVCAG